MGGRKIGETARGAEAVEAERIAALHALEVLDSVREEEFDAITALAARLFKMPVCLVSLIDVDRQWFKSAYGTDLLQTTRDIAFCAYAIGGDAILEVTDPRSDPRFRDNPLVTGAPGIRYYAGAPLKLGSGHRLGTLCLIDVVDRHPLTAEQRRLLRELARLVVLQLELRRLRQLERRSRAIAGATPDAIVSAGMDGRIIRWNPAAERMFGHSFSEAVGAPLDIIIPPHLRAGYHADMARLAATGEIDQLGHTFEHEGLRRDGSCFPMEASLAAWTDEDGKPAGLSAIIRDIGARRALETEKAQTQRFLDTVTENLPAMLFVKDANTLEYLLWNGTAEETTGFARDRVLGRTDADLFPDVGRMFMERDRLALESGDPQTFESLFVRSDGSERSIRTRRVIVSDDAGAPRYLLGISEDMTEWRAAQDRLAFLAGRDPLTHLANRASFMERLSASLSGSAGSALLAIDLDRFKAVNDCHGRHAGDLLLIAVAQLLGELTEEGDVVARIAADEFAILLCGDDVEIRAARLGHDVAAALAEPRALGPIMVTAGASVGIAVAPDHGDDPESLQSSADLALARARSEGGGRFCFFDAEMDRAARERRRIEARLRIAIDSDAIRLHYQPIACLEQGRVVGFEALARWHDSELGDVRPEVFISVAEESGLIGSLGLGLLRIAAAEAAAWQSSLFVGINLSPCQLDDPDFCSGVAEIIAETGLEPRRLAFEVTEGVLLRDAGALQMLARLKALGARIAMDDFGTGYSSLGYFRKFPFDKVKIDQSFVRDMTSSGEALAIVQAVIGLARGFGMTVVAEGVETQAQLEALRAEGCNLVQGYLIGRPAPIEAFDEVVIRRTCPPRTIAAGLRKAS